MYKLDIKYFICSFLMVFLQTRYKVFNLFFFNVFFCKLGIKYFILFFFFEGFSAKHMLQVLRHEESGICMTGSFLTTGSQVSVLTASAGAQPSPCCHWFTATPNPNQSIFKPFFFGTNINIGDQTTSPTFKDDPAKVKPRFKKSVDRRYPLYKAQENMRKLLDSGDPKGKMMLENAQMLEGNCVGDVEDMMKMFDERSSHKVAEIFKHMVDLEMNFYHSM